MERIQKKEEQNQAAGRGLSPVQIARVMGNQAVVQMIRDEDLFSDHFRKCHMPGGGGDGGMHTVFQEDDLNEIRAAYPDGLKGSTVRYVRDGKIIATYEGDRWKFHHYESRHRDPTRYVPIKKSGED